MIIPVTRVYYTNYDEDDKKLSNLRLTTVKRDWIIDLTQLTAFGQSELNKDYIEVWFNTGDMMFIAHDLVDFTRMVAAALAPEEEDKLKTSSSAN